MPGQASLPEVPIDSSDQAAAPPLEPLPPLPAPGPVVVQNEKARLFSLTFVVISLILLIGTAVAGWGLYYLVLR